MNIFCLSVYGIMASAAFFLLAVPNTKAQEIRQSEEHSFKMETVVEGLDGAWSMAKLPDGRFLVTERPGRIRIVENGQLLPNPVEGLPEVRFNGQGGLLDIEPHPNYAQNGWIYFSYSKPGPKGSLTVIARAKLKDNALTDLETIFEAPAEEFTGAGQHFGGRIEFGRDGCIYFSIGDRGDVTRPENNAQKLTNVKGKIHRLMDDGKIPPDNPFVNTPGASPSIWAYGNRNPQGLRFEPGTDNLWETEHGPQGGDELNLIKKGLNYGWPVVTFGKNYGGSVISDKTEMEGMESPATHWTPSIAVSGIDFYKGDKFPKWKDNLFVASLGQQKFIRVVLKDDKVEKEEIIMKGGGRMRDVHCFDDGFIHIVFEGKIVRLVPAG